MDEFQIGFKKLILEREGVRLNSFFREALDIYEEQEQEFIKWFMQSYSHKHINVVECDQMTTLFEDLFPKWYHELKTQDIEANE